MTQDAYCFDDVDLESLARTAAEFGESRYGYIVTPNTDHLLRLKDDALLRSAYADASFISLDSRFVALLLRVFRGLSLPICTGSDLTEKIFTDIAGPEDNLVFIGGSSEQSQALRQRYGLKRLMHYNPPMGFIRDEAEVEACLQFIESHSPFRFCLLAIGSPQQEILAQKLRQRGKARGLSLCIGASVNFLTGKERRAPRWMQRFCLEWLYRLIQDPKRLAYRYLVRGPRILPMLGSTRIVLRQPSLEPAPAVTQRLPA